MGKGGKAQTVGYKYYLGMHLALCHGPIDKITRLQCDDRDAWTGDMPGGTINVSAENLFGGEGREGGVSGVVDVMMGAPTQGKNGYLVSKLGALVPAYRGVVSLVFRGASGGAAIGGGWGASGGAILGLGRAFYLGNNPYLKTWSFRGQRIHVRQNGIAQWYDVKAEIPSISDVRYAGFFLVWEMRPTGGGGTAQITPAAVQSSTFVTGDGQTYNVPLRVKGTVEYRDYPGSVVVSGSVVKGGVPGNPPAANEYKMEISDPPAVYHFNGGNFGSGEMHDFNTVINVQVKDGATITLSANTGSDAYMAGTYQFVSVAVDGLSLDLNPAHIIRECITDPDWGMGYTDDDVDEASFTYAADKFYQERLGVSLLWDKQIKIEDFVQNVVRHADAALYVSRTTGKFTLKPIRADYNEEDLITLDESNIVSVTDPVRVSFGELTNSVTVTYWDYKTGKDATVTVTDTALVQQQGVVINSPVQYPGFTNATNATIAAQRDLRALSSPLLSCTILADSDAKVLNIGDVFKFSWAKWGLVDVIMRVTGIAYGTGRNNRVKINCSQDVFDTDTSVMITVPPAGWEDPSAPPSVVPEQLATEAPYYELVQVLGQSDIDNKLLTHPEIGYVIAAAGRPSPAINASLFTDNGDDYERVGALDFCPFGYLLAGISKTQTTLTIRNGDDREEVVLGTHFQIGDELLRVDALDVVTGVMTVGRGCLDTVPAEHAADEPAFFWDQYAGFDPTEYVTGEEIDVKILPVSGAGVLPIDAADAMAVTIEGRAARPYAPGDLRLNGESYTPGAFYEGEVTLTWTHRNRLEQTGGHIVDHSEPDIGPEPGVVYRVQGYVDDVLEHTEDDIAGNTATWTPAGSGNCRVEVHAKRDGLYSWQAPSHVFFNSNSSLTEDNDERYTEQGDALVSED